MWTKYFLFVVGILCISQVISQDIYVSEVMVESNVTLSSESILASWNKSVTLTVNVNQVKHDVTIFSSELVAECLVVGEDYSCNCSTGYAWSNEVCYKYNCCSETECRQNLSLATSICVPKTQVSINGTAETNNPDITILQNELKKLNGFLSSNITTRPSASNMLDFVVNVSVRVDTPMLQQILTTLETNLMSAPIYVDSKGMVNINAPTDTVKYEEGILMNCTMEEASGSAGWHLSRQFERFEIKNGQVAKVSSCPNEEYQSFVQVSLTKVSGQWEGTYECGFTTGTVRHTASSVLKVALLPDVISMRFSPLIADCSDQKKLPSVTVTATIPTTKENYTCIWSHNGVNTSSGDTQQGIFFFVRTFQFKCEGDSESVEIIFTNRKKQSKKAFVNIPLLHETANVCPEEIIDSEIWPKTPPKITLFNNTCPLGRVGYKSRSCDETGKWQNVYSNCISEELSKVSNAAENFLNGLGATQEVAKDIFEGIKNSSTLSSGSGDDVADISASIGIIGVMANASENIQLNEDLFPDLVNAASNMVNSSWSTVNDTVRHSMSSKYLSNVENLVKHIKINTSDGFNTSNVELRFCSSDDCSMSVFGIDVNMNKTNGTLKTMGVKNLMEKLRKNPGKYHSSTLLSVTLVDSNNSDIKIKMFFPDEQPAATERLCVFWDTKHGNWSNEGCVANVTDDNQTLCECEHLTSFSVLMGKSANVSSPVLDIITYIGLGVSVFSLLIFLFVEFLVWSAVTKTNLSHFRHTAVVNIAMFRLLGDWSFLAAALSDNLSDTWCLTLTVCQHLFYLAMFCWMLCLSIMLVHQLIFVFSPVRKRVFMYLSSIVGYVLPIGLVGSSYVYYKYQNEDYYDRKSCWLRYVRLLEGSIHAFLLPVGTIVLSNLFSMVVVIVTLVKTSVPDSSKADDKDTAKSILKVVVFLSPVFGVTWIIGFALLILDENTTMWNISNYSFTILNSFQGLFIMLTGIFGEQKVRQELIRIIMVKTGRDTDSMKKMTNSSTTLYTKDK